LISTSPWSTLFPYTTLFRSGAEYGRSILVGYLGAAGGLHLFLHSHSAPALAIARSAARGAPQRSARGERLMRFLNDDESSDPMRSEEHTSELQSRENLVCRL